MCLRRAILLVVLSGKKFYPPWDIRVGIGARSFLRALERLSERLSGCQERSGQAAS
jgi:hypothetical protein